MTSAGPRPAQEMLLQSPADRRPLFRKSGVCYRPLLIVVTVALYHPVKRYPFVTYDDRTM